MVEFAGWEMPIWYKDIASEHMTVRNSCGIFDVSHMGRFFVQGQDAVPFLEKVFTNYVSKSQQYQIKYCVACNDKGGILDDITYFNLGEKFMVVVNASNREKMFSWFGRQKTGFKVSLEDKTLETSMIAVQGPKAEGIVQKLADVNLAEMKKWKCGYARYGDIETITSGTGYTGENGFEITVLNSSRQKAEKLVNLLFETGKGQIAPCGLGARDTLRLEAGNVLYGHEIDESTTPLEAGLGFVVKFDKDFIGKPALANFKPKKVRVGFEVEKGIPRQGYDILKSGKVIGKVTSGTFSPLLKQGIGMGFVPPELAAVGETLEISIRGKGFPAKIVDMPFYDATKYGRKRVA